MSRVSSPSDRPARCLVPIDGTILRALRRLIAWDTTMTHAIVSAVTQKTLRYGNGPSTCPGQSPAAPSVASPRSAGMRTSLHATSPSRTRR
jgi:hypothetical protein